MYNWLFTKTSIRLAGGVHIKPKSIEITVKIAYFRFNSLWNVQLIIRFNSGRHAHKAQSQMELR